ncbi:hypothetical protein [Caballeronia sp. ATUFL_M1_KS5A]|uniref:hypothetical protein n=1 Tax=Caballeronia sp. ATUFL_M1_KS5A TaxID=2921778 RepID=UPI0032ECCDC1
MAERRAFAGKAPASGDGVTDVADIAIPRGFTTKDFTALRAHVQRIAPAVIARTYNDPDDDPHAATPSAMERYLKAMLDTLVQLALAQGSTALAEHLRASIKQHGQPKLTAVTFRMITEAAQLAAAAPHADHAIGAWLRPRIARLLKGEGIATRGARRILKSTRTQLVALESAHRPRSGARDRQLAAQVAGGPAADGRHRRRLGRARWRAASRGRARRGGAGFCVGAEGRATYLGSPRAASRAARAVGRSRRKPLDSLLLRPGEP